MKLLITTQYRENYGAHNWDGTGFCPQRWKNKGGFDYFVKLTAEDLKGDVEARLRAIIDKVRPVIEQFSNYSTSHIISWEVVEDSYMTQFDKDQLEFDGKITYATEVVEIPA